VFYELVCAVLKMRFMAGYDKHMYVNGADNGVMVEESGLGAIKAVTIPRLYLGDSKFRSGL